MTMKDAKKVHAT